MARPLQRLHRAGGVTGTQKLALIHIFSILIKKKQPGVCWWPLGTCGVPWALGRRRGELQGGSTAHIASRSRSRRDTSRPAALPQTANLSASGERQANSLIMEHRCGHTKPVLFRDRTTETRHGTGVTDAGSRPLLAGRAGELPSAPRRKPPKTSPAGRMAPIWPQRYASTEPGRPTARPSHTGRTGKLCGYGSARQRRSDVQVGYKAKGHNVVALRAPFSSERCAGLAQNTPR